MARKEPLYFQCGLRREAGGVVSVQTSYLPEQFAETGRFVSLRNVRGEWEDGWRVVAGRLPGEQGRSVDFLIQQDRQAKKTRAASDV